MKKSIIFITACFIVTSFFAFTFYKEDINNVLNVEMNDTSFNYFNGLYEGQSRDGYSAENYWGHIRILVANSTFEAIDFMIRDSSSHENVDSMYGVIHYQNIPAYQKQCVNDGNGIKEYPKQLLEKQSLDSLDAISGATWSYNIFIASAKEALDISASTGININNNDALAINVIPNPSYSIFNLNYSIPYKNHVKLFIYDNQGKLVKILIDQEQCAGNYSIPWNDCPSAGLYTCCLQVDNSISYNKIVKLN